MYCKHQVFKRREYYCNKHKRRLKINEKGSIYQLCRKDDISGEEQREYKMRFMWERDKIRRKDKNDQ